MESTPNHALHACPSCGRATPLTSYDPEPTLCAECQQAYGLAPAPVAPPAAPDVPRVVENPGWGIPSAMPLWVASFCALLAAEAGAAFYIIYAGRYDLPVPAGEAIVTDPPILLARFAALGLAHAITLLLAWLIVTDAMRLPFFKTIGWGWRSWVWPTAVAAAFVGVFVVSAIVSQFFPEPQNTPFHEVLRSSLTARLAVGLFAVLTAPLVEEVVYRGVMYPALARRIGRIAAILAVSALFLLVHADQYAGAPAIMVPLGTLSLALTILRAYSGSLLPSFALHLVFNGFQVILILITGGGPPPSQ
jgi:membrane protease YdiL (CAAX protease family)